MQIGLAYLAMEKYESARDAFQASLKGMAHPSIHSLTHALLLALTIGSRAICARVRCLSLSVCVCVCVCARARVHVCCTEQKDEEVESLWKRASIMAQMKFVARSTPAPDVRLSTTSPFPLDRSHAACRSGLPG